VESQNFSKEKLPDRIKTCVEAGLEKKAEDLVVLNLMGLTSFSDYFVIMHGNSVKHNSALHQNIERQMKKAGVKSLSVEGKSHGEWILMDFGGFIVHVFTKEARDYYALEKLWGDAEKIAF
jgi:ribosome-associated protein